MKRFLHFIAISLFATSVACSLGKPKELDVNDFSKGIDTYHDSSVLPEGYVQDAQNVYFNRQAPVEKRKGYTVQFTTKTYQLQTLWNYTDQSNTTWLIVRATDSVIAENVTSGAFVKVSTVSANDSVDETNAFGFAYFVDPTQGVYYWNGTSTTYVTGSPHGSIITQFHSRVWVAGQAVPNGNILNGSKFLDGTVWTTGINPTDPVQFTIGLQDSFDNITTLYGFLDTLYVMKYTSIYALYGFDQTNFQNSVITRECGCIDKNTVQPYNKGLRFVSLRGIEAYDGYNCTRVSDAVKNLIDPAINVTSFNQSSWVQQTQADWQAGTLDRLSATISPPSLLISTQADTTFSQNSPTDWALDTLVQVDTVTSAPGVILGSFTTTSSSNYSASLGNFTNDASFGGGFFGGTGAVCTLGNCPASTQYLAQSFTTDANVVSITAIKVFIGYSTAGRDTTIRLKNDSAGSPGSDIYTAAITGAGITSSGGWLTFSPTNALSANTKYWVYIDGAGSCICGGSPTRPGITENKWFASSANPYSGGNAVAQAQSVSGWDFQFEIDTLEHSSSSTTLYYSTGSITSTAFNVARSTSSWLWNWSNLSTTETDNGQSISYYTQTSTDGVTWNGQIAVTPGTAITSPVLQYIRYIATLGSNTGSATPVLSSVSFSASGIVASSGTLKSQIHSLGTISSLGSFPVSETLNSGAIAFSVCTSTFSNMAQPVTCKDQAINSQITNTVVTTSQTYVQYYATFTITAATQTPSLQSVTVQWYSGTKAPPMSSAVFDNRYWLSVSTDSTLGYNNLILLQDITGSWTKFDIKAGGLSLVKNNLYHSDASPTGKVYLDDQGYNDNGSAINAYVKTKDYNLGSQIVDTVFDSLWLSASVADSSAINVSYQIDKGTATYSLADVLQSEFASTKFSKIPFPWSNGNPNVGQSIAFTITNSVLNGQLFFEGLTFMYHDRPPLE